MCSVLVTTRSIIYGTLFEFMYIFSGIYTLWFFYKNCPKDETTDSFRTKMLFKYIIYIGATVIMFISLGIAGIASELSEKKPTVLLVCELISNISATIAPIILCLSRL